MGSNPVRVASLVNETVYSDVINQSLGSVIFTIANTRAAPSPGVSAGFRQHEPVRRSQLAL